MMGIKQFGAIAGVILLTAAAAVSQTTRPTNTTTQPGRRVTKHGWFPARVRAKPTPKLPEKIERAFVIPIHVPITDTSYETMKAKVTRCKGKGAQLVIFDMDTPGGSIFAMQKIIALITKELDKVYTVAYVRDEAISAGAVISMACDEIIMAPASKLGDSMPIMMGPGGGVTPMSKELRGKMESYLQADITLLVERIGHSIVLCESMITMTKRVWLIRNPETRELKLVDPDIDNWASKITNAPATPGHRPLLTAGEWEFVKEIDGDKGLFTPTAREAVEVGLVDLIIEESGDESFANLKKHFNITTELVVLKDSWSEGLVAFLTSPTLVGILMMLGVMGVYMEFQAPGFGLPGAVAITCFAIVFGSHFLVGLAQWWEIALFFLGLTLIAMEVFVIPGFGVAGISGILCCTIGLLAAIIPNAPTEFPWPETALDWSVLTSGMYALGIGGICGLVGAITLGRYLPKIPVARRFILAPAHAATDAPATENAPIMHIKVGDTGTVETMCRPVGTVRFGRELCDATSDGSTIETGVKVRVIERTGNQLIVEEA